MKMNRQILNVFAIKSKRSYWTITLFCVCFLAALCLPTNAEQTNWKAGVASTVITPEQSMWMAGYAARNKPSEGKINDLNAKALALADEQGTRLVIVTVDLLGIPSPTRAWLEKKVRDHYGLAPDNLLLNASHTHSGPVVRETRYSIYSNTLYGLTDEQIQQSNQYVEHIQEKILQMIGRAIDNMAPAQLGYTHGRASFAMNRRSKTDTGYRISPNPDGPVDHDVPVLRVDSEDGKLHAVLFGYACHNTTLSGYEFCGDYAGFAQQYIQDRHPQVTAMFIAGCGADQNPYPRPKAEALEYCKQHARGLANGVEAALEAKARPVAGPVRAALDTVQLPFAEPPSRRELVEQTKSDNKYERIHAEALLKELDKNGAIRTTYPYLVQVVRFGDDLTMVALAGEVVVDYSLRLKKELPGAAVWIAGYSNDVFGYVPSLRVLREGGYEGGDAMRYTQLPGPFAPSVEEKIVSKVHELVTNTRMTTNR